MEILVSLVGVASVIVSPNASHPNIPSDFSSVVWMLSTDSNSPTGGPCKSVAKGVGASVQPSVSSSSSIRSGVGWIGVSVAPLLNSASHSGSSSSDNTNSSDSFDVG